MHIKIYCTHPAVYNFYKNHKYFHEGDSGLDLFIPKTQKINDNAISEKIDFCIRIESTSSFFLIPRSSLGSKTPIRLSNSIGLIDKNYRGHIMAFVDNIRTISSDLYFPLTAGDRWFQIISPTLEPITFEVVNSLSELSVTDRGEGGFGSTGN